MRSISRSARPCSGSSGATGTELEQAVRATGQEPARDTCEARIIGPETTEEPQDVDASRDQTEAIERQWKMCALPELRDALTAGRLTHSKALLVANHSKALLVAKGATPHNVEERIEEAASTTWQQTERENTTTTAEEERQNRAAGIRRLWGPGPA